MVDDGAVGRKTDQDISFDEVFIEDFLRLGDNATIKMRSSGSDTTVSHANLTTLGGISNANLTALTHTPGTGVASQVVGLDSSGDHDNPVGQNRNTGATLATEAGTGITTGTGTVYQSSIQNIGGLFKTTIIIDVTGLNSNVVSDIIGVDATANCHLGQIVAADCGTIFGGKMTCLEAPLTGEPDIDLFAADEATGTEDAAITALTNDTAIVTAGTDWTLGLEKMVIGIPAADQYLYLVGGGGTTDATYTAGKFLIELYGY